MTRLAYAGVGSRATPLEVCNIFTRVASRLELLGWRLMSGGAPGADIAFELGVVSAGSKMIFVPWARGSKHESEIRPADALWAQAEDAAAKVHPVWSKLPPAARALHTRNVFQVLGPDLKSSAKFVICWTADGAETEATTSSSTGGTRTAIVLASRFDIPVLNFRNEGAMRRLKAHVEAA